MKVKNVVDTCGPMGEEHGYLGHFRKAGNLTAGHNTGPSGWFKTETLMEKTERQLSERKVREAGAAVPVVPVASPVDESKRRKALDEAIRKSGG